MAGISKHLQELLNGQSGVVALWQMEPPDRRAVQRSRSRNWQEITPRVVLFGHHEPDDEAKMWAALLHCGPSARLAGSTALALHGWKQETRGRFQVVVPAKVSVPKHKLLVVRRVLHVDGPPIQPARVDVHESVLQAGAWSRTPREAVFIVISALQQRLVDPQRLLELLRQRPRLRRRHMMAEAIDEYVNGIHSMNEHDLTRVCAENGLPVPVRQVVRFDSQGRRRCIDAEFVAASGKRLRVEVQGLHHLNPDQWTNDTRRRNSLVLAGESPHLEVLAWELRYDPQAFVAELRFGITEAKIA